MKLKWNEIKLTGQKKLYTGKKKGDTCICTEANLQPQFHNIYCSFCIGSCFFLYWEDEVTWTFSLFVAVASPCFSLCPDMQAQADKIMYIQTVYVYCQTFTPQFVANYFNCILCNCAIFWRGCYGDKWRAAFTGIASILSLAFSEALGGGCWLCIVNKASADYAIKLFWG